MPTHVTVTAAEIARLAGVGRAAVSNWRRRHDDFPARVGGSDASPLFDLEEVRGWLRRQGKLTDVPPRELLWPEFDALADRDRTGMTIAAAGREMLARSGHPLSRPAAPSTMWDADLARRAADIADQDGVAETFSFLAGRWLDAHVRQITTTPPHLARLMAELAVTGAGDVTTVLDPACGTGALLLAALEAADRSGPLTLLGQERDATLADLAAVRLAVTVAAGPDLPEGTRADVATGDSLLADAYPEVLADAVLCNPPFNERAWGHEDLTNDQRWAHGVPPRTESELAWVQHALARTRPGGHAVVLMPPAAASRRTGRRIRAELLRRGALRAVVALPPGAAPPYSIALHLWVLRRPAERDPLDPVVLLVDAAGDGSPRPWDDLRADVVGAWEAFAAGGAGAGERPGLARAVRAIDLLDDEVDLTPARRVPRTAPGADTERLRGTWDELSRHVGRAAELANRLRALAPREADAPGPATATVADLLREGALTLAAGAFVDPDRLHSSAGGGRVPLLTAEDVADGTAPSRFADPGDLRPGHPRTADGDVVVLAVAREGAARVVTRAGDAVGGQLALLRPAAGVLDPWFLAGCLRAGSNVRRAGTHASTSSRMDVRRLRVPRLPLDEQRRIGVLFRELEEFDTAVARAGDLGAGLTRALTDALARGAIDG